MRVQRSEIKHWSYQKREIFLPLRNIFSNQLKPATRKKQISDGSVGDGQRGAVGIGRGGCVIEAPAQGVHLVTDLQR